MEKFELENSGIIFDKNPNDFMVGSETPLIIPQNTNTIKHFYNQAKFRRTRNACGLYASAGCISDYTGYKFSDDELLEIVNLAEKSYGWKEDGGMFMSRAVDCLRNWWNAKFPNQKLMTFRFTIGDERYHEALKKRHSLATGYNTSRDYLIDSQDDGIISQDDYILNGGGHLVRVSKDLSTIIRDNYFERKKFNSYTNEKMETLRKNGVFFPSTYIFVYQDQRDIKAQEDRIASEIEMKILEEIENGTKRIVIHDNLVKQGYTRKNILNGMAKVFGVNAKF